MRDAPTLIDRLYRLSFGKKTVPGWKNNAAMRAELLRARRFVLDEPMSEFLGELSTAAFTANGMTSRIGQKLIEQLRTSARLPHPATWVEYNLRSSMRRSNELLGKNYSPHDSPALEGWLIRQHSTLEFAYQCHIFGGNAAGDVANDGFDTWTFPVAYAWTADQNTVLPWLTLAPDRGAEYCVGLSGYRTDRVAIVASDLLRPSKDTRGISTLIKEWTGVMRRVLSLIATIGDLPVVRREVRAARGFLGKGNYRRFLDHSVITLTVPTKEYRAVARRAVAAMRRRAHMVRGHWRKDHRHPGERVWVREHQRGDAGLGFVTHDYSVQRG